MPTGSTVVVQVIHAGLAQKIIRGSRASWAVALDADRDDLEVGLRRVKRLDRYEFHAPESGAAIVYWGRGTGGQPPTVGTYPFDTPIMDWQPTPRVFLPVGDFWDLMMLTHPDLPAEPDFTTTVAHLQAQQPPASLSADSLTRLVTTLQGLPRSAARAFHETLVAQAVTLDDAPLDLAARRRGLPLRLEDDHGLAQRLTVLCIGPVTYRAILRAGSTAWPQAIDGVMELLDVGGRVDGSRASIDWPTVFNPRTGSGGLWDDMTASPDVDSLTGFLSDPRPTGPFEDLANGVVSDDKQMVGVRIVVPDEDGWLEAIILARVDGDEMLRSQCRAAIAAFLDEPHRSRAAIVGVYRPHLSNYWPAMQVFEATVLHKE